MKQIQYDEYTKGMLSCIDNMIESCRKIIKQLKNHPTTSKDESIKKSGKMAAYNSILSKSIRDKKNYLNSLQVIDVKIKAKVRIKMDTIEMSIEELPDNS